MTTTRRFLYDVPNDIIISVLDNLLVCDPYYSNSRAIFSIACACRRTKDLVNSWCNYTTTLSRMRHPDGTPLTWPKYITERSDGVVSITDVCKRLGWVCALCNNRAKRYPWVEPFTNLQLCMLCDTLHFPKCSLQCLVENFSPLEHIGRRVFYSLIDKENIKTLRSLDSRHVCSSEGCSNCSNMASQLFRRDDIVNFIEGKDFKYSERPSPIHGVNCEIGEHYLRELMEAMGLFGNHMSCREMLGAVIRTSCNHRDHKSTYIPHSMRVLLSYVELTWTDDCCCCMPNDMIWFDDDWDEILFKEFRYQFDSTLKDEEKSDLYQECTRIWKRNGVWEQRPWSPENFPLPPPAPRWPPRSEFDSKFDRKRYRLTCSSLRFAFKLLPDVIKEPSLWDNPDCGPLLAICLDILKETERAGNMSVTELTSGIAEILS